MKQFKAVHLKGPNSLLVQHGIKDHSTCDQKVSCIGSTRLRCCYLPALQKRQHWVIWGDSVSQYRYGNSQYRYGNSHSTVLGSEVCDQDMNSFAFRHRLHRPNAPDHGPTFVHAQSEVFSHPSSVSSRYMAVSPANVPTNTCTVSLLLPRGCGNSGSQRNKYKLPSYICGINQSIPRGKDSISSSGSNRTLERNFHSSVHNLILFKPTCISLVPSCAFSLSSQLVQPVKTRHSSYIGDTISCGKGEISNYFHKRDQSSSPVISSPTASKPILKNAAEDSGKQWTFVSARDYGKSIPVNQETVPVTTADIRKFLLSQCMKFDQGHTCFITSCPRLTKRKLKLDEADKLYVNMTTGSFVCHTCRKFGDWTQLQDNINLLKGARKKKDQECFPDMKDPYNVQSPAQISALWDTSITLKDIPHDDLDTLLHLAGIQGLSVDVLSKYNVRVDETRECLLVPVYFVDNTIHAVKKISIRMSEDGTPKGTKESVIPRGDVHGLFGWNTIDRETTDVVLTASEFDAMAVYQETKVPAIALPKGDSVLPQEILPLLEQFTKIVLWFKNDIRSWEAARQFSRKLNVKRCFVIRPSSEHPNALEAVQQKYSLFKILQQAKSVSHQSITSFSQLRQEVFSELAHVEQVAGIKWKKYPHLNKLLKGHRRGELTIFTGPTGSGKTTFISDYSLDLCMQGVNTLWGSFEINNVRLMKMMLTQFSQLNMSKHLEDFDQWADRFEMLPMYFMMFYGQESIKKVIETMSHAVYVHDIAHVVVDNLQFMMGVDADRQIMDRFQRQDQIVAAFRKFATTMNCHVTVVVHPRKEKDNDELTTASIYGSAKASQEADNVMILQDKRLMTLRGKKYLQISKNRFDGELGMMLLKFDKETLSFEIKPQKKKEDKESSGEEKSAEEDPEEGDSPES